MTNEEKAAILLLSLDENVAAGVMKNLRPSEVKRIGKYMNRIKTIPSETLSGVAKEFIVMSREKGGSLYVGDDFIKNILTTALGQAGAEEFLSEVAVGKSSDNPIIDKIRDMDPKVLLEFTRTEHPQTIALILAHMLPDQAAIMLEGFTGPMQIEIARRMATLKTVPHEFLVDVAKTLEKELVTDDSADLQVGGVKFMSEILNRMSRATENAILTSLEEEDTELATELRGYMFTFEDVLKLDNKSLQELLREISTEDLSKAMKMVDEELRTKIYSNMSKRGAEMLKEDIEMMPPIRLSEVEASQRTILDMTKKLEAEGRIMISRGTEEDKFV
jgi:flagellar motor switch protein FliG